MTPSFVSRVTLKLLLPLVLGWCHAARAEPAETPRTSFLVATTGDTAPGWLQPGLAQLTDVALSRGWTVAQPRSQVSRFESAHSSQAVAAKPEDIQAFKGLVGSAMRNLADLQYPTAMHSFDAAFRLYERSPDDFNRSIPADVLDACLFRGRALLETGSSAQDVDQHLLKCRMLLPRDVEPRMVKHASIASAWSRVVSKLHEQSDASLEVTCQPGCLVSVNAVPVGQARPIWEATQQTTGSEVRVAAECAEGQAGRVHRLVLKSGPNRLQMDCAFERALRSRPALHLLYPSADERSRLAPSHARIVANVLDLDAIVLVIPTDAGASLELVERRSGTVAARAQLGKPTLGPAPWSIEQVQQALTALQADRAQRGVSSGAAAGTAATTAAAQLESASGLPAAPKRVRRAAWTLAALGVASYAAGLGLHIAAASHYRNVGKGEVYYSLDPAHGYGPTGRHPDAARGRELSIWELGFMAAAILPTNVALGLKARELGGYARWARVTAPLALGALAILAGTETYLAKHACPQRSEDDWICAARDLHTGRAVLFGSAALSILSPGLFAPFFPRRRARTVAPSVELRIRNRGLYVAGSF